MDEEAMNEWYMERAGMLCPFCKSADLTTGTTDYLKNIIIQVTICGECDHEWEDVYTLTELRNIPLTKENANVG